MEFLQQGFLQAFALLANRDPATYSAIITTIRASSLAMAASLLLGWQWRLVCYWVFPSVISWDILISG
jgi:ABC-type tungstate transport system substrate-binding protein